MQVGAEHTDLAPDGVYFIDLSPVTDADAAFDAVARAVGASGTGRMPTEEEIGKCERVVPIMNEALQAKGLVEVAEDKILVTGLKGPLEEGWKKKVESFVDRISEAE